MSRSLFGLEMPNLDATDAVLANAIAKIRDNVVEQRIWQPCRLAEGN